MLFAYASILINVFDFEDRHHIPTNPNPVIPTAPMSARYTFFTLTSDPITTRWFKLVDLITFDDKIGPITMRSMVEIGHPHASSSSPKTYPFNGNAKQLLHQVFVIVIESISRHSCLSGLATLMRPAGSSRGLSSSMSNSVAMSTIFMRCDPPEAPQAKDRIMHVMRSSAIRPTLTSGSLVRWFDA